jgi:hypothetical protein
MNGKITAGNRGKKKNENPKSLPYFNLVDFPFLHSVYGDEPTRLIVQLPGDTISEVYSEGYEVYKSSKGSEKGFCTKWCDGETCNFRQYVEALERDAVVQEPCHCEALDERTCRPFTRLKVFVLNPDTMMPMSMAPIMIETHSEAAGDSQFGGLSLAERLSKALGRDSLFGYPVVCKVRIAEQLVPGPEKKMIKKKFPVVELEQISGKEAGALSSLTSGHLTGHAALTEGTGEYSPEEIEDLPATEMQGEDEDVEDPRQGSFDLITKAEQLLFETDGENAQHIYDKVLASAGVSDIMDCTETLAMNLAKKMSWVAKAVSKIVTVAEGLNDQQYEALCTKWEVDSLHVLDWSLTMSVLNDISKNLITEIKEYADTK